MVEIKLFNRWSVEGLTVTDPGLKRYISLTPLFVPKTPARYAGSKFHKSRTNLVERMMNKLMVPGHKSRKHFKSSGRVTGKSSTVYKIMEETFKIIESKSKKNPVEVLLRAVENAAPREEIISIEYGGARYPKAVECAPQRRIDLALRWMTQGVYQASFNSKRAVEEVLADEILNAYALSPNSGAIAKKLELERQADASR
jgi:small subunit ribosomal protein S7